MSALRVGLGLVALGAAMPAVAQTSPPSRGSSPALDPSSPLAPLPGLGVAWPDLSTPDAIDPGLPPPPPTTTTDSEGSRRYGVTLIGVEALPDRVRTRFDLLSALKKGDGKPANAAQIDRRARDDAESLTAILRTEGYYDAIVETAVAPVGDRLTVTLSVTPGALYAFSDIRVTGLGPTDGKADAFRDAFGVNVQAPVSADAVLNGETALREKLGREGFPFAKVAGSAVVVDHATRTATLDLTVDPGRERRIAAFVMRGDDPPFGAKHAEVIARFEPGELYDQDKIDDLRRAMIATGLASTVKVEPVARGDDLVDIATTITPAPLRTVAGEIGYGTGEGFRVAASWQHRNLIRPEGAVTVRGVAGTREQSLGAALRMGNFKTRDVVLNGRLVARHEQLAAYDANTFEIAANIERQTNLIWQKKWVYSLGFELLASDERDFVPVAGIAQRRTYFIGALPATLAYDSSDDLLNPSRGFRLAGRLSPELSFQGNVFGYARLQVDGSVYVPFGDNLVIAARTRLGAIAGAGRDTIAPSRLFYTGGGGSVRGYGYQEIGQKNVLGQPDGGRSLAEFSLEARVRLPVFGGNFGIVPFVDAGGVFATSLPSFDGMRIGAGLGLRYYSNFGPIRIDLATPFARQPGETPIAVYVSLGQAF